jgi:hypothetical protein
MKFKIMIENFAEIVNVSTTCGVSKIFRSKRLVLKTFWMIFFLMVNAASFYFIFDLVADFNSYTDRLY